MGDFTPILKIFGFVNLLIIVIGFINFWVDGNPGKTLFYSLSIIMFLIARFGLD